MRCRGCGFGSNIRRRRHCRHRVRIYKRTFELAQRILDERGAGRTRGRVECDPRAILAHGPRPGTPTEIGEKPCDVSHDRGLAWGLPFASPEVDVDVDGIEDIAALVQHRVDGSRW